MKEIRKEIQRTETIVTYESVDGQIFTTKESCKAWEESYKGNLSRMFKEIPQIEANAYDYIPCAGSEEVLRILKPRNKGDVDAINACLDVYASYDKKRLDYSTVGTEVVVVVSENFDYDWYYYGTVKEYLKSFREQWMKLVDELNKLIEGEAK